MLCQGQGRPRKQVSCCVATLTSSQKEQLRRIGKVLRRKQLKLRRQRILKLATTNFCSKVTGHKSSIRDLKNFARHLGKRAVPHVLHLWQQSACGVLEDRKSSPQCGYDCVCWNNIESRDMTPGTASFEDIIGSKDNESPFIHMDQWVGVEVHLFGRKNSIGEVGSTTSNVCDKLRSVVAYPEREDIYPSLAKRRIEQYDKKWSSVENDGIIPSWMSCRRSITRINASCSISNDHIAALLASLPKTGRHIDDQTMTPINISSTKEIGLYPCANEGAILVDQSSIVVIPMEQSFISQGSNVNSYKDLSLDFNLEKQANISVLHRDAIQVCPSTPEKAQKRRRSYQDTIPNCNDKANVCELSSRRLSTGNPYLCPSVDVNNFKELGGQVYLTNSLSPYLVEIESNCNLKRIGAQDLNTNVVECTRTLVDSMPIPTVACPLGSISHVASVILDPIQESSQHLESHEPSALDVVMEDGDKSVKEGGQVLLTNSLSPYSIDFESSCNSTKIDKQGSNVVAVECTKSLVESTSTPTIANLYGSASHMETLTIDLVEDHSQLFQMQVPTAPILMVESNKRKGKCDKSKLNENSSGIAIIPKVRKKYKPRVAKVKQIDKCNSSQLPNETNKSTKDHGVSKHARKEGVCHDIIRRDMYKDTSTRNNCISNDPLQYIGTIESSEKLFQEESIMSRLDELASKPTTLVSLGETPFSVDNTCITRNVEGYMAHPHPPPSFDSRQDIIASDSLLCNTCGLTQRMESEGSDIGLIKQTNNLSTSSEDQTISNLFIERQKQFEALSVELSTRVIALLDLPSIGQSHSLYSIAGEVEQPTSDVSLCYEEIALKDYPQIIEVTDEYDISSFSDEWTAYHVGCSEMTALDAFNEEEMRFDMFFREQQSTLQGDALFQNLNGELNEHFSSNTDTRVRESLSVEDHCGVSSNSLCGIDELGNGSLMRPNPSQSLVHKSFMAQKVSPEPSEERTMSSFYASTSTGVTDIMLSRLNKMIEENFWKDKLEKENVKQDLSDCGQIDAPTLCSVQKSIERCKGMGLLGDYCLEEEDLMKVRNTIICQMRSQFQNSDLCSILSTEADVVPVEQNPKDLINMRDAVLCQMRFQFQDSDPDSTFSTESNVVLVEDNCEDEDLMKMSDTILQMHSQFLNPDPNSFVFTESAIVSAHDTPEIIKNSIICQSNFQSQDANPNSNFIRENTIVLAKVNDNLEEKSKDILSADNAILNLIDPQKNTCLEKGPFHLMTFIQLMEYIKAIVVNTSKICPLELSCHIQSQQSEEERIEFEKLWPVILHPINSEQLQNLMDLAEIDFSSIMKLMQCQQVRGQEDGEKEENQLNPYMEAIQCQQVQGQDDRDKEENHLAPCMEVIQYQKIERQDERAKEDNYLINLDPLTKDDNHLTDVDLLAKEDNHMIDVDPSAKESNHMTDIVPFVGNAIVAYDGSFFPLQKRKPRPKVNLDTETIRVWKLLMGKTESMENDPDLDNELKWKHERLIMQEQAETFIRRMHLIQGDRSFSCWKGSIVDSVIGVFLTQNVSDVLSSSAYMCLRARFPLGRRRGRGLVQSKSLESHTEEIFQGDIQINLESFQTFQKAQTSCFHKASSNCAPTSLANEGREEILHSQECCNEENNTSNLESRQGNTLLFPWSESPSSMTLQQNESVYNTHFEQPLATDTSMNVSIEPLELNVNANENVGPFDLEIMQENILFLSRNDNHSEPSMSSIGQGENNFEPNAHCITQQPECNLTKEVVVSSNIESQLALSTSIHLRKEELTGLERARLEAKQVCARKSSKWNALAEKYNAKYQQAALDATSSPHTEMMEDGVDWEAVRCADLEEIADAIKERGMNWKLAGRIKGFLERLRLEQGNINLEWLRSIPSDDAKEFLSSVHGLGLKSVECIRLLSLHHLAFPVDTNVGRICVRLGWVPLEPLPEELQLHVLELYPVQATIQKYLWPRLCTLDQQTLYELHYQLITFGKVFCTKSKPNCNACPMRADCKHFASALASAKLALLPPEDSSGTGAPLALPPGSSSVPAQEAGEASSLLSTKPAQPSMNISQYCQPIIVEPMTPDSEEADMSEFDIEDYPFSIEEIPHETMMELIIQEIHGRQEMQENYSNRCCKFSNLSTALSEPDIVQEMEMADIMETPPAVAQQPMVESSSMLDESAPMVVDDCEDLGKDCVATRVSTLFNDAPSREVVMLPPGLASLPVPKLKNIERLRTVHYVYELPDNHPLLEGMDVREADDPCFYLLAIWSSGEVPESIPNINDDNEETGFNLSNDEESIKATLLVPCRTAMQGSFPLNGTYFQVNEVFADHDSSLQPILVPRVLLWNLRRRFVYFGTSVTSILRGMTTEEIQACFWRGYVCVRGFDRMTRAPKPLVRRLHFQTTKSIMKSASVKNTKT